MIEALLRALPEGLLAPLGSVQAFLDAGGWVLRDSIAAALRASTGRDGNPEQVDRSINRLRDIFRKEQRLPGVPKNGFIETKPKVGCRLTLASSDIGFMA